MHVDNAYFCLNSSEKSLGKNSCFLPGGCYLKATIKLKFWSASTACIVPLWAIFLSWVGWSAVYSFLFAIIPTSCAYLKRGRWRDAYPFCLSYSLISSFDGNWGWRVHEHVAVGERIETRKSIFWSLSRVGLSGQCCTGPWGSWCKEFLKLLKRNIEI